MLVPFQKKYLPVETYASAAELKRWFASESGLNTQDACRAVIERILPNLFGYHIALLGDYVNAQLIDTSRISHRIVIGCKDGNSEQVSLLSEPESLAIEDGSLDVLVIPHTLEFAKDPHQVLREAERVLIGEGHILILCFNPWSVFGLWRLFVQWRDGVPWRGRFTSLARVRDWLKLLGFDIEHTQKVGFRPPIQNARFSQRLLFMEKLGAFWWPVFGNVSVVLAKKRVTAVTPLKTSWETRRRLVGSGVVEPTTRNQREGKEPESS